MMLLVGGAPVPMAGSNPGASLSWMWSSLLVLAIALSEEMRMIGDRGSESEC
jgi:hypothetical protein